MDAGVEASGAAQQQASGEAKTPEAPTQKRGERPRQQIRKAKTLLRNLRQEVTTGEDFRAVKEDLEQEREAWDQRLAEIIPQIERAELSAYAAAGLARLQVEAEIPSADLDRRERCWFL